MATSSLTLEQPHPDSPFGQPYGVQIGNGKVEWFSDESAAWDYRDQLLDDGFRKVRTVGCPAHLYAAVPDCDRIGSDVVID